MAEAERTPWHLWVVGGLSALWNASGAYDYAVTQMRNEPYLAQLTEAQRAWLEGFPAFVNASWGLAVAGAVAGALLLLARSRHAVAAFVLSLGGMLVTTVYQYGFSSAPGGPDDRAPDRVHGRNLDRGRPLALVCGPHAGKRGPALGRAAPCPRRKEG